MPQQHPDVRNKNFKEVALGYTKEQAMEEATRCLDCKNPKCVEGCPVNVPIPQFINAIKNEDFEEAYKIITSKTHYLQYVEGYVLKSPNVREMCKRNKG